MLVDSRQSGDIVEGGLTAGLRRKLLCYIEYNKYNYLRITNIKNVVGPQLAQCGHESPTRLVVLVQDLLSATIDHATTFPLP